MAELRSFLSQISKALTYPIRVIGGINTETITATKALTLASSHVQVLNPSTGSRDVTLPALSGLTDGLFYVVRNSGTGGYSLVVKDATPATICTVGQGQYAIVMCDLVGWRVVVAPGVSLLSLAVDTITESTSAPPPLTRESCPPVPPRSTRPRRPTTRRVSESTRPTR